MKGLFGALGCLGAAIVIGLLGLIYIVIYIWLLTSGNVAAPTPTDQTTFWWGLVHGLYLFPSWIASLFYDTVAIYQSPNNGGWYDTGFVVGAIILITSFFNSSSD
jgi:hypothetical protein